MVQVVRGESCLFADHDTAVQFPEELVRQKADFFIRYLAESFDAYNLVTIASSMSISIKITTLTSMQ